MFSTWELAKETKFCKFSSSQKRGPCNTKHLVTWPKHVRSNWVSVSFHTFVEKLWIVKLQWHQKRELCIKYLSRNRKTEPNTWHVTLVIIQTRKHLKSSAKYYSEKLFFSIFFQEKKKSYCKKSEKWNWKRRKKNKKSKIFFFFQI